MSSAKKVRPTDSLLRYLNDSLQSGWAPVQTWPGSPHGEAPLQKAAQPQTCQAASPWGGRGV